MTKHLSMPITASLYHLIEQSLPQCMGKGKKRSVCTSLREQHLMGRSLHQQHLMDRSLHQRMGTSGHKEWCTLMRPIRHTRLQTRLRLDQPRLKTRADRGGIKGGMRQRRFKEKESGAGGLGPIGRMWIDEAVVRVRRRE